MRGDESQAVPALSLTVPGNEAVLGVSRDPRMGDRAQRGRIVSKRPAAPEPSKPDLAGTQPRASEGGREDGTDLVRAGRAELRALAQQSAAGDERAFGALQQRLRPALVRMFQERTQGRGDLAEDLAQRALLGLWQALQGGRYEPQRAAVTTFAYAIAGKVWLQHLRASGRRDAALERYARLVARGRGDASPGGDAAIAGEHAALLQAMRDAVIARDGGASAGVLSEDERWLVSSWALGESDRTLAKKMGIAPSNVNVRKQRAYAKLRAYLTGLGFGNQSREDAHDNARRGAKP